MRRDQTQPLLYQPTTLSLTSTLHWRPQPCGVGDYDDTRANERYNATAAFLIENPLPPSHEYASIVSCADTTWGGATHKYNVLNKPGLSSQSNNSNDVWNNNNHATKTSYYLIHETTTKHKYRAVV